MVLFKRLEYKFNGYKVPQAARSPRRRAPFKRKSETNHLCAFDLLATVAGKLLLEGESSYSSDDTSTKKEGNAVAYKDHDQQFTDENQLKVETFDQGMENRNSTTLDLGSQVQDQKYGLKESSVVTSSDSFEKANSAGNLGKGKEEIGSFVKKIQAGFSDYKELSNHTLEERAQARMKLEPLTSVKASAISGFGAHDIQDRKPLRIGPDFSPRIASDYNYHTSSQLSQDDVKVVRRDDDENSSGCSQPYTEIKAFRSPPRLGDRRIKRLVASKYWNVCSRTKNGELAHSDGDRKNAIHCRKSYFKSEWSQRNYPLKKRKLLYHTTMAESDEGTSDDGILHFLETESNEDVSHSGTGKSNSDSGQHAAVQCRDFCVKLRIKSFRVPELFVEIPETATIGSLKRAVMDGVTAILGGGLHIGVLLQGKKVRDDNKTLRQTGISHDNQLVSDALGFSLEPNLKHPPQPMCTKEPPPLISSDNSLSLTRYLSPSSLVNQGAIVATPDPPVGNLRSFVDSDHDSAPSPTEICLNKRTTYNKTIVPVPSASVEALAVVPVQKKSKHHPESAQRRIRRPFSVSEVEALVQAVEKLGTGRWRDVKLRAFDNAKHRTYVDLKDKWKTLVHTARISPQQRRGEPVPQELLDRVLTAHAYWSQQQAKQQLKQQTETLLLL